MMDEVIKVDSLSKSYGELKAVLPFTQGIIILKSATLGLSFVNAILSIGILVVIAVVCSGISLKFFRWE